MNFFGIVKRGQRIVLAAALGLVVFGAGILHAQVWIQVESQPDIRSTKSRAQVYGQKFSDTQAYQTATGWYAIVIGPMGRDLAESSILSLKSTGQIPGDAFISDGSTHISQLFPVTANTNRVIIELPDIQTEPTPIPTATPAAIVTPTPPITTTPQPQVDAVPPIVVVVAVEPPALIADLDLKATKALERSWTREQKKHYQTLMVWTGDYDRGIDGAYGPGTRRAIKAFQEREGFAPTGYLTQTQVDLMQSAYSNFLEQLGMQLVRDLDAGIEVQMPMRLVQFEKFEPPFVHYGAKPGSSVRAMMISQEGNRATLKSLYDIMETFDFIPTDGYRTRKRDWFVLSGKDENVVSYTYVRLRKGLLKGFTLVWSPEQDADMKQAATIMYNSFNPIADYVLDETLGYGENDEDAIDLTAGIDAVYADRQSSGFIVSANGTIITHNSAIDSCKRISLGDDIDLKIIAQNPNLELAVLQPDAGFTPQSYALFSAEKLEIGTDIAVAGYSYPDVMEDAALSFGTLTGTAGLNGQENQIRLEANLEAGDTGGPVLDDRGAVIGMQSLQLDASNPLPAYVNFATKGAGIMAVLDRHKIAYGRSTAFDSVAPEDLIHMISGFTVKISCWE